MRNHIICITIFLSIFGSNYIIAQEFWALLNFPDTVSIRCMDTNNEGHIFVGVGNDNEYGGIYKSENNGTSWALLYNNGNFTISSIAINENDEIYAGVNGFDRFIVSRNDGIDWEVIDLPDENFGQIVKIECRNENEVYICPYGAMGSFIMFSFDSGLTWQTSYVTNKYNEYVSDLDISNTGEIYVSTMCFEYNQGGVYKSSDLGYTWDYVGLLNHQVLTIEVNSNGDVFAGDWWVMNNETPGIHALYNGSDDFELIRPGGNITDIAITSDNHIYAATYSKVYYSFNNGNNFYPIEDTLSDYVNYFLIDSYNHLYAYNFYKFVRSLNPVVTGEAIVFSNNDFDFSIYPNPAIEYINIERNTDYYCKENYYIEILSLDGHIVFKKLGQDTNRPSTLRISSLQTGEYIIRISSGTLLQYCKFIKL